MIEYMNKIRKEIERIRKQIAPLSQRANELENEEILNVQKPRMKTMVGCYLRSTYEPTRCYGKILDLIESKNGGIHFILEVCSITKEGNPYVRLDNASPYLNKEWWDTEPPLAGWEKCTGEEYSKFKDKVLVELNSQKSLRRWISGLKY